MKIKIHLTEILHLLKKKCHLHENDLTNKVLLVFTHLE